MGRKRASSSIAGTQRKSAVLYARVSSKEQEQGGFSIDAQRRLLRDYAASKGISIAREFTDVETAKRAGRTRFGEMVAFLKKTPSCRIVLVEKTDRLYRNFKDYISLDDLDVELHFVKENSVFSRDSKSAEKFIHGIKVLMAKNYSDNLSEETGKGMREKAAQGLWPSYAPLGYRNTMRPDGKKGIEPDSQSGPLVVKLFEWYGTGKYSVRQTTRMAQEAGLVTRQSGSPVRTSTVHNILRSRVYMGDFDWDGRTYEGAHSALVSKELWEQVQQLLNGRSPSGRQKRKHEFAFSGLIKCGHCGCSLVGQIQKGRYVYYHCTGYKGKCDEPYVREERLEERFADLLRQLSIDDEATQWIADALRESHRDESRFHAHAIGQLQERYDRLRARLDAMYVDKLDGRIDLAFFERKAAEWRAEQDRLLESIEEHKAASESYVDQGIQLLELAVHAHTLFTTKESAEKRRLLSFLLSNCSWKNGELVAEFRQPFNMLAVAAASHQEKKAAGDVSSDLPATWYPRQDSNLRQPV